MKLKALKTKPQTFKKIQATKPVPEWQMTKYFNFYINDVRPKVQQIMTMIFVNFLLNFSLIFIKMLIN